MERALESFGDPGAQGFWTKAHQTMVALDARGALAEGDRDDLDELIRKVGEA